MRCIFWRILDYFKRKRKPLSLVCLKRLIFTQKKSIAIFSPNFFSIVEWRVLCIIHFFCFWLDTGSLLVIAALLPQYFNIDSVNEWSKTDSYDEFNVANTLRVIEASTAFEVQEDGKGTWTRVSGTKSGKPRKAFCKSKCFVAQYTHLEREWLF